MSRKMHISDILSIVSTQDPDRDGHDHPIDAISGVLLSAAILQTTNTKKLAAFTDYGREFISAIALNMMNSRLWIDGRYHFDEWFHPTEGIVDHSMFFEHNQIAGGSAWKADVEPISVDACEVYWNELQKKARMRFRSRLLPE